MGTNYYLHEKPKCESCGREDEPLHIGKSSAGWVFGLHVIPDEDINSLDDWQELWDKDGSSIIDEYGSEITVKEMEDIITDRGRSKAVNDDFDYGANHAEPGPNNLVRHIIDRHCVGHGEGTWDLIAGEFS